MYVRSRSTGATREILVAAMGSTDETYLAAKAVTHPRMQQIAPVLCVSPDDVEEARIAPLVRKAFGLWSAHLVPFRESGLGPMAPAAFSSPVHGILSGG